MNSPIQYYPHIDALRTVAVALVLFEHFLKDWFGFSVNTGSYGVDLFFVISGFLITSILLKKKITGINIKTALIQFYIKRVLRLFPAYYLLLIVLLFLSVFTGLWIGERKDLWYHFTYLPNILYFLKGFQSSLLNHNWSLGIEEQFYMIWPLLLFAIPLRLLGTIVTLIFISGIIIKGYFIYYSENSSIAFLPIGNFSTLGVGSLLAVSIENKFTLFLSFFKKWNTYIALFLFLLLCGFFILKSNVFIVETIVMLLSFSLVVQGYFGFSGPLKLLFDYRLILYFGKISYGIYLYHKPIPFLLSTIIKKTTGHEINPITGVIFSLLLTFIIAHFSWKYYESYFLKLKTKIK